MAEYRRDTAWVNVSESAFSPRADDQAWAEIGAAQYEAQHALRDLDMPLSYVGAAERAQEALEDTFFGRD